MLRWLKHLLFGRLDLEHIELDLAENRMTHVNIRRYSPRDFDSCRQLYILNEPGRFPHGHLANFEKTLASESCLFIVLEKDDRICGCGGVAIHTTPYRGHLCYGLIHPECHGQGLGTTLLLARLALLPEDIPLVTLSPVPASRGFYERFNFRQFAQYKLSTGEELPVHLARFSPDARSRCESMLGRVGITLSIDSAAVPIGN